jgi:heparosan-N-sulfate-glucuronate 5-epimerase
MNLDLTYPFDWRGLEDFRSYDYDQDGLPRVYYAHGIGLQYNPITMAQYGLYCLQQFQRSQRPDYRQRAFACGDWLLKTAQPWPHDLMVWRYDYSLYFYGPEAPWISAMAQAEGVSLLLRCHQLQPKKEWRKLAEDAIRALDISVADGGTRDRLADGSSWFEEYPTAPPSHVLNGHLFSLFGAIDMAQFTGRAVDQRRVEDGLHSLETNWQQWDCGFWTLYDLHSTRRLASRMYQKVHIRCLQSLFRITGRLLFRQIAETWQRQLQNPLNTLRMISRKSMAKIKQKTATG